VSDLQPYQKPYKTGVQLCDKLKKQGLIIDDIASASKVIQRASYYRFKAYLFPFQDDEKNFLGDVSFEDVHNLYRFDEELRILIFRYIQHIEIGTRSLFDQKMTEGTTNPFWYLNSSLFTYKNGNHAQTVNKIRGMFVGSKEEFASHYIGKYYNEYCPFYLDLPPGWVAIELMSFGNLSKILESVTEKTLNDRGFG
jgi:abortive infection bacteriophage resistance protein